jgi:hypothetical protein
MSLWDLPDFDTLLQETREMWRALRTAFGTAPDTGPGSDVDIDSQTIATSEHRLHRYLRLGISMLFPQSASGRGTVGWAQTMGLSDGQGGIGPVLPDTSSATDGLRCSSTSGGGTADLNGLTLLDTAGNQYQVNESISIPGASQTVDADVVSIDTGLAVNLPVGSVLTFESPIANLEAEATIVVELEGGVDAATDPETNSRTLSRWRDPSLSGNNAQWKRWVEETDAGVFDAWIYPRRYGYDEGPPVIPGVLGTVDYCATLRGFSRDRRVISATQKAAITANVVAEAPIDLMNNSRHLDVTAPGAGAWSRQADVELYPSASDDNYPDFDAYTLNAFVNTPSGWDDVNKVITANKNVCGVGVAADQRIEVGDIVLIGCALATVLTASYGGDDAKFQVSADFDVYDATSNPYPWWSTLDPSGMRICAGGGVVRALLDAGMAYADSLGPARGLYAAEDDIEWDDTMRYKKLQAALDAADDSVMDAAITPASDDTPVEPGGSSVLLPYPSQIAILIVP